MAAIDEQPFAGGAWDGRGNGFGHVAKRVLSYCSIRQAENRSTSASTVDLVESELAVFEFARDRATEIASGFAGTNNLEIEIILSQVSREFYSRIL